jgi:hypothetical protein
MKAKEIAYLFKREAGGYVGRLVFVRLHVHKDFVADTWFSQIRQELVVFPAHGVWGLRPVEWPRV